MYSVAVRAAEVSGSDEGAPVIFRPIAHTSAQAVAQVMHELRSKAAYIGLLRGEVHVYVKPTRTIGGYDMPEIEEEMRLAV